MRLSRFAKYLYVPLCGLFAVCVLPLRGLSQQINFSDFNGVSAGQTSTTCTASSAASGILLCFNYATASGGTDGFSFISDSSYTSSIDPGEASTTNQALQFTGLTSDQTSSMWYSMPQNVAGGFTAWYAVKLTYSSQGTDPAFVNCCTADGIAFVIQNAAGGQTDSISGSSETGSGSTVLGGGGGSLGYGGIDNSIALEMDTFYSKWDPQDNGSNDDNHMALQGCGPGIANSPAHVNGPNCLISLNGATTLISNPTSSATASVVRLADGNPHQVVIVYNGPNDSPANYLYVYLDPAFNPGTHSPVSGSTPLFSGPFDITQHINLNNGTAYIGFTAANGFNFEQHELMGFSFTPHGYAIANVCAGGQASPAPCSETLPVTVTAASSGTINSIQVVTQGTSGLDFSQANGGTCSGAIAAGNSCTVNVTFAPLAPGLRMGAVELLDGSGNLLATQFIYGVGEGPAVAFGPGTLKLVNTGSLTLSVPNGVAVDAAGDVFISDSGQPQVVKVPANGIPTTVGSGLNYPQGLAVDGAGNLFIADNNFPPLGGVIEVPAGCTSSSCHKVVVSSSTSSFRSELGVAVDGSGDVFFSDFVDGQVAEIPAGGSTPTVVYNPAGSNPIGLAVDAMGDLFIADFGLAKVVEIPAGCTSSACQIAIGAGWFRPEAVAVDAAGDVFVADEAPKVVEVPAGCTDVGCQITLSTDLAYGVAVDGKGNIFIPDRDGNTPQDPNSFHAFEINRSTAPTLTFDPSNIGSSSFDSPQSLTVQNIGNQKLSAISPGLNFTDQDFLQAAGSGTPADCSANFSLAPAAACDLSISFKPLVQGPLAGSVVLTDNSLNGAPSTQTISLGGTGLGPAQLVTVTGSGTGSGFVQSNPTAINCNVNAGVVSPAQGSSCSAGFAGGSTISFESAATGGSTFTGWGGACAGFGTDQICVLTVGTSSATVSASFDLPVTSVLVPNVVGMTQADATSTLASVHLSATTTTAFSSAQPAGSVVSETPAAGTPANTGTSVSLVISSGPPPAPNQLTLQNNYFVTGDYAAAGVTLRGTGQNGVATGTITIGHGTTSNAVPDGADVLAAYLYWETVENTPSPSGATGSFRGYSITGQQIGGDQPYTDGALNGTLRVYRADVNAYFAADASGLRYASGTHTLSLPDGGANALPHTQGASLVVIYRVLSPSFPLKAVVIYDGAALPTDSTSLSQTVLGFYDAVNGGNGAGEVTNLFATGGNWHTDVSAQPLGQANQFTESLAPGNAYAAVILSTPVNNSDNDGILDAWKAGPGDQTHGSNPGYYDAKTGFWVGLPGAVHGQKDLFVQLDYMCGAVSGGICSGENLFPSPDANGNDPLAMVTQAFAKHGVHLHLDVENAIPEETCTDNGNQLCEFPNQSGFPNNQPTGVINWKNSMEIAKLWPRNPSSCAQGGDCTPRFAYGRKDSYHYVLFGHALAIPAWNGRFGSLLSINVAGQTTTIVTTDRGTGINACPSRITISGVLGNPGLNGVYNTTSCADSKTISLLTPASSLSTWSYPNNTLPEPLIGITSGNISSISGYSDLGGADSAVTLGLWLTAPNQDMSKRANVLAGTMFHEIGHTLGLTHGGLYFDSGFVPTFEANCKPNYQSSMNYLFQLDGVGPNQAVDFSGQTLTTLNESQPVGTFTDVNTSAAAAYPTSAWYAPYVAGTTIASPATRHCDGTPLNGDSSYRIDASVAPITPAWAPGQDVNFDGQLNTQMRGYNDWANIDLRQVGATGGQLASLASVLSFGSSVAPLDVEAGGNVTLGSGGTVTLGSGGTVTLGSGGNITLGSGGTITLGSGGLITMGSGGTVTLGSGGTIALTGGGSVDVPPGGSYTIPGSGGTITLGSGGNVTLGSGGNVTLGSGGLVTLGSGGTITLGSGGLVTLGSGGTVTLGSGGVASGIGGTVTLGSGGNVTLGSGGTVTLGSGGNITLGSGGTVTLGSGGNVTLGSGGTITLGSGGLITMGSGGLVTLGSGGTVTDGGNTVQVPAGGSYTFAGSGGLITLGSGGNITLGSGGNVTLGSGGNITLGSGGNITLGSGGTVTLGSGGNVTLGSGGLVTLGSGGNVTLGSGGLVTLGSGGLITLGSGGLITMGSGGNITLGSGGATTDEMTYDTANSVVRPPSSPGYTPTPAGIVITWTAPAFGVVQTYTILRSSDGAPPVVIGSVSGVGGNPPATTFTDLNPDKTATTVVYTITTTLVPDTVSSTPRQSPQSPPAVLKNDQSISLSLPGAVSLSNVTTSISATAETNGTANGQQVTFAATGSCTIGGQSINVSTGVSSAAVNLNATGGCNITASQAGSNSYNAATPVSGSFQILPQGSNLQAQTITFAQLPNIQYGNTFSLSASSSSGLAVSFGASGPCTIAGTTTGAGICTITASAAGNNTFSPSAVVQSFTIYPAVLKVMANNLMGTFGQALPTLTYQYSGFIGADTGAMVNGMPALSTTATITSNPGNYPITVATGTLASTNYSFLYVSGTLTIQRAPATISIGNIPANASNGGSFTPTYIYSGNGAPTESVASSTPAVCTVASGVVHFVGGGTCTLTASATATTDYAAATGSPQSFTVVQAPAITSAGSATFTVGTTRTFTVTTGGYPLPTITETGSLPGGVAFVDNHNGTGTLSGKATASGIFTITFKAQNGIGTAATQTFTLTSETTVPSSGSACNGVYVGTFSGSITVSNGQSCIFLGGGVTGNITETGGNVVLSSAAAGGNVTITGGTYSIGPSTTIKGNLVVQSIPTGTAQNQICGTTVGGNLVLQSVGTAAVIGSSSPSCPGNTITGSLTLQANRAAIGLTGNTVNGSVTDQSNTAATTLSSNTISGSLTNQANTAASLLTLNLVKGNLVDQSNSASSILSLNTVGLSLTDQGNTGPTQVTSNKITGTLLCQSNSSITGSGNTAAKKQGQCATF